MTETLKSRNGRREALIHRSGTRDCRYLVTLTESRRLGSSMRQRKAMSKPEAVAIARTWVKR